tara:strand:+ start:2924 stop:3160 length:237 start_codon:yes stop_codon:yes gene_type:complete
MRKLVAFVLGLGLVATAFAGLALAVVLAAVSASVMLVAHLTGRLQPAVARPVRADQRQKAMPHDYRVWNDGRGTIIDM